ncbi:MAG: exopolysaccharide biosynthesis polyprenyl glycosylphosphotransferase [Schleiferiaceae bacterium]|nr:exopolysaccharide biosynthesis polyprenyl glycosylphosphotransferase [Schleiferiaceae bacterium]
MKANRLFSYALLVLEILLLAGSFAVALYLRYDELRIDNDLYYNYYLQLFFFLIASWLVTTALFNRHHLVPTEKISTSLNKLSRGFLMEMALVGFFIFMMKGDYSRLFFVFLTLTAVPSLYVLRILWIMWFRNYLKNPQRGRNIVLIGNTNAAHFFEQSVHNHPEYGLRIQKWLQKPNDLVQDMSTLRAGGLKVDELYVSLPPESPQVAEVFRWAEENLVRFRFLPELGPRFLRNASWEVLGTTPILKARKEPLTQVHNRLIKRLFDVVFATIALLFLVPLVFPWVAIAIKWEDGGSIFFKQLRSGQNNRSFSCWKFRTMKTTVADPTKQAIKNDQRVTRIGHFLRKHNLDELPQFYNVLKGEMSVVGPRPHMLEHTEAYRKKIAAFMVRHAIVPGLTGLAQVRGFRGPTEQDTDMELRIENDVYYLENWSLFLDMKIILKTIWLTIIGQETAV